MPAAGPNKRTQWCIDLSILEPVFLWCRMLGELGLLQTRGSSLVLSWGKWTIFCKISWKRLVSMKWCQELCWNNPHGCLSLSYRKLLTKAKPRALHREPFPVVTPYQSCFRACLLKYGDFKTWSCSSKDPMTHAFIKTNVWKHSADSVQLLSKY